MEYKELIETISEIVENDNIKKENLTLIYELDEKNHSEMDEHLFYVANPMDSEFTHREVIEVVISGIMVKFIKKSETIDY